jgi:hypothetical protein
MYDALVDAHMALQSLIYVPWPARLPRAFVNCLMVVNFTIEIINLSFECTIGKSRQRAPAGKMPSLHENSVLSLFSGSLTSHARKKLNC